MCRRHLPGLNSITQVFQVWYFALYAEKLNRDIDRTPYKRTFPKLPKLSRKKQKQALRDVIARYRKDTNVMDNPKTERIAAYRGAIGDNSCICWQIYMN